MQTRCARSLLRRADDAKAPSKKIANAANVDLPFEEPSRREKRYLSIEEEEGKGWTERWDGTVLVLSISPDSTELKASGRRARATRCDGLREVRRGWGVSPPSRCGGRACALRSMREEPPIFHLVEHIKDLKRSVVVGDHQDRRAAVVGHFSE